MSVSTMTRQVVILREFGRCFRCRLPLRDDFYSIHHRKPRGMGGTKRPEINQPANLLAVCGSGTTGCHGWIESHRTEAEVAGFLIRGPHDPQTIPVMAPSGFVLLDNEGGYRDAHEETA